MPYGVVMEHRRNAGFMTPLEKMKAAKREKIFAIISIVFIITMTVTVVDYGTPANYVWCPNFNRLVYFCYTYIALMAIALLINLYKMISLYG